MMGFVHALTLWAALAAGNRQVQVDITRLLLAGLVVMFALIGNVMGKVRRNFYVGMRFLTTRSWYLSGWARGEMAESG